MEQEIVESNISYIQDELLASCIEAISHYCHSRQACNKCKIREWCKNYKNKCPEEWRNKVCQEINTQVVDQDKKN